MKKAIQKPKGTADILPSEVHIWHYIENMLRETAALFGYPEIRVPTFEHTELFLRGVGDTTDIVNKEMYTFLDKGDRSITLRPEGTASVVRAFLENGLQSAATPFKAYYILPNFRYEKPQSGRLREHHQFGCECFGAAGYATDCEIISLVHTFLKRLSIDSVVKLNSIGCPNCRPKFNEALRAYFEGHKEALCPDCKERLAKNPLRILDCKSTVCQDIAKDAPKSMDYLCDECHTHFDGIKTTLGDMGIEYEIDTGIVRGIDYYTKTVFEFIGKGLGTQNTICGGGRYDGLVEELGGQSLPGMGFGCGVERLIMAAKAAGFVFPEPEADDIVLIGADEQGQRTARKLTYELRLIGAKVECDLCERSVKAQMKHADRLGARYTAVVGQDEIDLGEIALKNMQSGEKMSVQLNAQSLAKVVMINGRK